MGDTRFSGQVYQMGGVPLGGHPMLEGGVFYVNGTNGNDAYIGSLDQPLLTMKEALSRCTDDKADVIYVLDYWQPTGEDWPISVNKTMVHIIGNHGYPAGKWAVMASSGNYPIFDIVSNYVIIDGVSLYPTAGYPGITMDDGVGHVWIKDVEFQRGSYGVQISADDTANQIIITDCYFIGSLSSGGIYVADDTAFLYIARNMFDRHTGISIDIEGGAGHYICDNRFAEKADTSGLAITLGTSVARAFVSGNEAAYGKASGSTSPYLDEGTVTTNNWGLNYKGKAAIDPD